jgi:hypothetical protein
LATQKATKAYVDNKKAAGSDIDTGTDDTKYTTAKSLKDSHNVPNVAPGTSGNVLTSDGTDWTSTAPSGNTDGWTTAGETWTYASASTITVPSGAASRYSKGDKIKWTQTTVKYGVITAVADTLLTIAVNTDYTVANATITNNYYSHQSSPIGFPAYFNFSPTWTGNAGTNPDIGNGSIVGKFTTIGTVCQVTVKITMGSTTTYGSGGLTYVLSRPITPSPDVQIIPTRLEDTSSGPQIYFGGWDENGWLHTDKASSYYVYTTSPFTFANGDTIFTCGSYIF